MPGERVGLGNPANYPHGRDRSAGECGYGSQVYTLDGEWIDCPIKDEHNLSDVGGCYTHGNVTQFPSPCDIAYEEWMVEHNVWPRKAEHRTGEAYSGAGG